MAGQSPKPLPIDADDAGLVASRVFSGTVPSAPRLLVAGMLVFLVVFVLGVILFLARVRTAVGPMASATVS